MYLKRNMCDVYIAVLKFSHVYDICYKNMNIFWENVSTFKDKSLSPLIRLNNTIHIIIFQIQNNSDIIIILYYLTELMRL